MIAIEQVLAPIIRRAYLSARFAIRGRAEHPCVGSGAELPENALHDLSFLLISVDE
jgi:hypothetical protein